MTSGSLPGLSLRPLSTSTGTSAWYSAVTPSSLKRAACVPKTGMSSVGVENSSRLRWYCLRTSRSASSAPLRSNLLIATKSAKSSMSIFSSCEAAPNSGVITYIETSTKGTMAASPWPMPEVSTMTRSKPASLQAAMTSGSAAEISEPVSRVASERMKMFGCSMAFIRMRSPSRAPPVRLRDGSIEIRPIFTVSPWSRRKRRTISSVSDDLPAPPVPVMPSTGTSSSAAALSTGSLSAGAAPFSSSVMTRASKRLSPALRPASTCSAPGTPAAARSKSDCCTTSLIMPCRPICTPSSGA